MATFKKGDKVRLVCGGVLMAVADVGDYSGMAMGPEDGVKCVWQDGKKTQEHVYDAAVLEHSASAIGVLGVRRG